MANLSAEEFLSHLRKVVLPSENGYSATNNLTQSTWWLPPSYSQAFSSKRLFLVGDSHVLSLAWSMVYFPDNSGNLQHRLVFPVVTTGLKAWHMRQNTSFFTRTCLQIQLNRNFVPTIVVSAGEIDCREGMGGALLQSYTDTCSSHVQRTVQEFVRALTELLSDFFHLKQILVMPVPPHAHAKKGRTVGQAARRETTLLWNEELRRLLSETDGVFFLDYFEDLKAPDHKHYALNTVFNADSTHMNAAFAPLFERSILNCGCDLDAL